MRGLAPSQQSPYARDSFDFRSSLAMGSWFSVRVWFPSSSFFCPPSLVCFQGRCHVGSCLPIVETRCTSSRFYKVLKLRESSKICLTYSVSQRWADNCLHGSDLENRPTKGDKKMKNSETKRELKTMNPLQAKTENRMNR